jgi:TonB-dependent SusC/RagA subfamily outer membrane receptor
VIENKALGYRIKYLLAALRYDGIARQFLYEGSVFFEEMKGTPSQEGLWKEKRQEVYGNSSTHFLRSAINNRLSQEGFMVLRLLKNPERPPDSLINIRIKTFTLVKDQRQYRDSLSFWKKKAKLPVLLPTQVPIALTGEDIVEKTRKPGIYSFGCDKDPLYIVYDKNRQFKAAALSHLHAQNNTTNTLVTFNSPFAYFDIRGVIINPESLTFSGVWADNRIAQLLPIDYEPPTTGAPVDSTIFKKIDNVLKPFIAEHPIEKAYLHFDKPYYAAGDTIYFKAYVTNALYSSSILSSLLNVELIGPDNKIIKSTRLKLNDGMAAGDFDLADSLNKGYYRVRAYTNRMRNAGEEYFFDQYLSVINLPPETPEPGKVSISNGKARAAKAPTEKTTAGKIDIQFFPEGGNLVNGTPAKIAFKAVGPHGLGIEVKGTITDGEGKQIGTFASRHLGMGTITMTPEAGKKYKANITADSVHTIIDLPEASDTGYALTIDNSNPRNLKINVVAGVQSHQSEVRLIAQAGGTIYAYLAGKLVNNQFTATIPKDSFPDGIVQFTLFTVNGEPMNERLVFIQNADQLKLKLATEKPAYQTRDKVKINLTAQNMAYQPVTGNFSIAVTNETTVPVDENNESTILSHLLLTSDLKGYIEAPNYYFNDKNDHAADNLDVLLLTQGYHRFEWRPLLNGKYPSPVILPESISTVSGKIQTTDGKTIPNGGVSLVSMSHGFFSLDTVADANGRFVFKHLPQTDSMRYIIQAADKRVRQNTLIELDRIVPPKTDKNKNAPGVWLKETGDPILFYSASTNYHKQLIKQGIVKHSITLKEVQIKERTEKKIIKHSDNLNGAGNANDVITGDQLPPGCPIFKDCIVGHLHGIQYTDGNFYYGLFPTLVLIDGIEVPGNLQIIMGQFKTNEHASGPQSDVLNTINPRDIASVEIITDASLAAIYGVKGAGGVIIITTKKWEDRVGDPRKSKQRFVYYSPTGYYKARAFYSPVYDTPKVNTEPTDLRTTIYWNPELVTDKSGSASFTFFNADTKGTYRVIVEGIDDNGHIGRQVYRYKVE